MKIAAVKRNKKGFTLVELVIVIAVLAILAAIAVPTVTNVITQANTNTDASNCQTMELAIKSAAAEATAGTWDYKADLSKSDATVDSITVADALKHEGLDFASLSNGIKSNSDKKFYYVLKAATSGLGHIYVSSGTNRAELASATKVSDYLAGNS